MKCFKCGSDNTIHVDFDDGTEMLQCNDCGTKMTISQPTGNSSASVPNAPMVVTVEPAKKSVVNKEVILEKYQVLKNWVKNPISMTSTVLNGVLLVVSIVLLVCLCNSGPSIDAEIKNYALTNGYQWADFDRFNSPAEENGLENTKVYFHGKVKDLTKVDNINIALIEDVGNSENVWGIIYLDNYIYSQVKKGSQATIFGYYIGFSEELKMPVAYYANGYTNNQWYEYEDSLNVLKSLESNSPFATEDSTVSLNTAEGNSKGNLGDYTVEIVSAHVSKNYKKRDCIIIEYKFSNNSDDAASFMTKMYYRAFQDGIELDGTYSYDDTYDNEAYSREIKPGKTLTVYTAFLLNDKTTPVEIEVKEFRSGEKVVKTFELTK